MILFRTGDGGRIVAPHSGTVASTKGTRELKCKCFFVKKDKGYLLIHPETENIILSELIKN